MNSPVRFDRLYKLRLSATEDVNQGSKVSGLFVVGHQALGQLFHFAFKLYPVRSESEINSKERFYTWITLVALFSKTEVPNHLGRGVFLELELGEGAAGTYKKFK